MEHVRVYLLDDHELVRRGLQGLFDAEEGFEVVGGSGSAVEAIRDIPRCRPDVALLDVRLQDGSGIAVCRELQGSMPELRTLMLTSYDDDEALFSAIMAGASGYLLKVITGSDVVDAVRRVAAGQSLIDPVLTSRVLERLRAGPAEAPALASLSEQEHKVLVLIAEGLTNRQIGGQMFLSEKTVKNYVSNVLTKLGLESRTQAAVLATRLLGTSDHDRG
ncbi:LuxR family two component transcriptional regulator [Isoptericola sp. CG 20/1183]|uniref:LuxR family two component transcriptional regulator n=1 Tax=Isoptericola halotolerans TaxID=300560 RepID=A0ABX5EE75_9MICO|nr:MULTISPECIES: response regulator transcription factor [Isoptericola]MCK0118643.1 response regulator transcription factor [Isoptericola sp. S6320L]PRZ03206.1 LuxR family two component transcriptional regulator [Isoptericola sp. CG 20/1183]PRZ03582.1 LuxR family two component transcriptional regulator [Isoptericola halotolerans]